MKVYVITQAERQDPQHMRNIRREGVFSIINRGPLWYETLSPDQLAELRAWYAAWLNYPATGDLPPTPACLENEVNFSIVE